MSSYRGTADRPDKAKAIAAVAAVHVALAFIILSGLNVRMVGRAVEQLTTINITEPPPPPVQPPPKPAPQAEGREEAARRSGEEGRGSANCRAAAQAARSLAPARSQGRRHRHAPRPRAAPRPATDRGGGSGNGPGGGGDYSRLHPRAPDLQNPRPRIPRPRRNGTAERQRRRDHPRQSRRQPCPIAASPARAATARSML